MSRRAALALFALTGILVISAAWWALALWPSSTEIPGWVERTRAVCFGVAPGGLPSGAGWLALIGEPLGMLGFLLVVWGGAVREGLAALRRTHLGKTVLLVSGTALLAGLLAAAYRVRTDDSNFDLVAGASAERIDRAPPPFALVDQNGDTVRLTRFLGRPVVLAFAYGHCETVCPSIVHEASRAIERAKSAQPVLLVVTIDPWRDVPSRLPSIASAWRLPPDARALGGSVEQVSHTLNAWDIVRVRDAATGEIVHQPKTYLLDRNGRIAYIVGATGQLEQLLLQL